MISVKVNTTGILNKIEAYRLELNQKMHLFLEELAHVGINTANVRFSTAQYDGINDVSVSDPYWISDTKLQISATGTTVTFIEFGSGVHYQESHPLANELGMTRGEYGKGMGNRDSWTYLGFPGTNGEFIHVDDKKQVVKTHGNPPARAMYEAGKDMRNQILRIAREVFIR